MKIYSNKETWSSWKGFELNTWAEKGQYDVAKGRKERQEEKKQKEGGVEVEQRFLGWTEKVFWVEEKLKTFWAECNIFGLQQKNKAEKTRRKSGWTEAKTFGLKSWKTFGLFGLC